MFFFKFSYNQFWQKLLLLLFYFFFSFIEYFFITLFQFFMFQDVSRIFWNVQWFGVYPCPSSSLLLLSAVVYGNSLLQVLPLGNFGNLITFFQFSILFPALGDRQACNSVWPYSQENTDMVRLAADQLKQQRTWKDRNQLHILANSPRYNT